MSIRVFWASISVVTTVGAGTFSSQEFPLQIGLQIPLQIDKPLNIEEILVLCVLSE